MRALKHFHSWKRHKEGARVLDKDPLYLCTNPDCYAKSKFSFISGKRAVCPTCKSDFIIAEEDYKQQTIQCQLCLTGVTQLMEAKQRELEVKVIQDPETKQNYEMDLIMKNIAAQVKERK